jgi:RHS repeat-associated protein
LEVTAAITAVPKARARGCAGVNYSFLTQKERDVETGLDYFLARYYSNVQGRFTSYDPLLESAKSAMPQSWNRYTYCLNNPLMYVDPDGLTWYKKKGSDQPEWRDENPGDEYEEITQHVYWAGENHGW